jgi:hypothetical protein
MLRYPYLSGWLVYCVCLVGGSCLSGCGHEADFGWPADESSTETLVQQDVHMLEGIPSESQKTETRIRHQKLRVDPFDKSTDLRILAPDGKAHWPGTEDDPRFVRETGFRPIEEGADDPRYVRETGFIPSPRIRLARMEGNIAVVQWNAVDGADHYLVSGIRFGVDGGLANSFEQRAGVAEARINTEGYPTQVMAVAVSEGGRDRSRPSNKLSIVPDND